MEFSTRTFEGQPSKDTPNPRGEQIVIEFQKPKEGKQPERAPMGESDAPGGGEGGDGKNGEGEDRIDLSQESLDASGDGDSESRRIRDEYPKENSESKAPVEHDSSQKDSSGEGSAEQTESASEKSSESGEGSSTKEESPAESIKDRSETSE